MARRPFFSGNYGSALGSFDTAAKLIAQAGQTQGQAMANIGSQVGVMIEQYGLNKEKQKENKATIKSSIGILKRMSKLDEANAPEYMASIQQLENEDISLSQRGMLADKTLQGLSITSRLQGQMISNQEKQQALGLARQLEASVVENANLQNTYLGLRNDLTNLAKRKGQAVTEAEIKNLLGKYSAEEEVRPSQTAAQKATNKLAEKTAESKMKTLPGDTSLQIRKQEIASKQLDIEDAVMDIVGIEGYAQMKADDLKTLSETNKANLEQKKAYAGYLINKGLADLVTAANKSSSTFKDRFAPLVEIGGKLLTTNVVVPGSNKRVPFKEYLELNEEDSTKYPMNGMPGDLFAKLQELEKSQQEVLRDQKVQVNVPDEAVPTAQSLSVDIGRQTPQQGIQTLTSEIAKIRQRIPQINAELQSLGQPEQTMPSAPLVPIGGIMGASPSIVQQPQTVNFIERQRIALPQERSQLQARLEQLEAKRQELQSQLGVR